MAYEVRFTTRAARAFERLPVEIQARFAPRVDALAVDPHPVGSLKLKACEGQYRLREGAYRLIYEVHDAVLVVLVVKVVHRSEAYR